MDWKLTDEEAHAAESVALEASLGGAQAGREAIATAQAKKLWAAAWPEIQKIIEDAEGNPEALHQEAIARLEALGKEVEDA